MNSTYFGLLAEFGEANISLDRISQKYFGLSTEEGRRRAASHRLPCRAFRLGGQKSPWLVSAADLAQLIDERRARQESRPSRQLRESEILSKVPSRVPQSPASSPVADLRIASVRSMSREG